MKSPRDVGKPSHKRDTTELLSLAYGLGYLKEDLRSVGAVSQTLNKLIRTQVVELELPLSSLVEHQQRLAWLQSSARACSNAAAAAAQAAAPRSTATRSSRRHTASKATQQQAVGAAAEALGDVAGPGSSSAHGSHSQQQQQSASSVALRLSSRMPGLGGVCLHNNSIMQPHALASQLEQLCLLTQLTSLELRDSCSWNLPCPGLRSISSLTQLKKLQLLMQSPGMPLSSAGGLPFPPVATSWQSHVSKCLEVVTHLTGLKHLQIRFICGERGYFMSPTLLNVASCLSQLSYLDLGYIEAQPLGLAGVAQLTQLQCLILYGNLAALAAQDFCCLGELRSLRRLEMFHDWPPAPDEAPQPDHQELTGEQKQQLEASLQCLTQLSWLNLPMSKSSAAMLPLLHNLRALNQLYLQSIERQQMEFPLACFGPGASRLKVLQIDNVCLTAQGLASIAGLSQLQQLTLFNLLLGVNMGPQRCLAQLSQLSQLQQLCFDSLVSDGPASTAVLDNTVLSALAPHWLQLQSLHISYAAVPDSANLHLTCFSSFQCLRNLSIYCFQHMGMQQQEVVLDASKLPGGLHSLCLSTLTLNNAPLLPRSLVHIWLADIATPDLPASSSSLAQVIAGQLPNLITLVLRSCRVPGLGLPACTEDLARIAAGCSRLECLGVSLPEVLPGSVDVSVLAPLKQLRQLLLDYCCETADPAEAAAHAAELAAAQAEAEAAEEAEWAAEQVAEAALAAAAAAGGAGDGGGGGVGVGAAGNGGQEGLQQPAAAEGAAAGQIAAEAAAAAGNAAADAVAAAVEIAAAADAVAAAGIVAAADAVAAAGIAAAAAPAAAGNIAGGGAAAAGNAAAAAAAVGENGELMLPGPQQVMQQLNAVPLHQMQQWLNQAQQHLQHVAQQQPWAMGVPGLVPLPLPPVAWGVAVPPAGAAAAAAAAGQNVGEAAAAGAGGAAGGGGLADAGGGVAVGPPALLPFNQQQLQQLQQDQQLQQLQQLQHHHQHHQQPEFDAQEVILQLSSLAQHLTNLRGLWLSDNVLAGAGLGLQHMLQQSMPYIVVRPATNDWFWGTNFPMGSCLNAENPMEWWRFTPWNIL